MHKVIERLIAQGTILTDGAWGTEFQARGLEPGECPDLWNLTHPVHVEAVARAYVKAGSQIILTNTFRANRIALDRPDAPAPIKEINRRGVEISRRAAGIRVRVFASLGPSGKLMMMSEISEAELLAAYTEQAEALAEAGVDALIFETMSDLAEAKVGVQAARATGLPVIVSMAFDSGKNFDRTMMGATPEQAAAELSQAGADVIGANCGQGIETYAAICKRLHAATTLPIWIKPNAGMPELVDGRAAYKTTPQQFARHAAELIAAGASFLGGCCGTNPEFIRALGQTLGRAPVADVA
jgi:methionine synthase I (cobalamin-dependent)